MPTAFTSRRPIRNASPGAPGTPPDAPLCQTAAKAKSPCSANLNTKNGLFHRHLLVGRQSDRGRIYDTGHGNLYEGHGGAHGGVEAALALELSRIPSVTL